MTLTAIPTRPLPLEQSAPSQPPFRGLRRPNPFGEEEEDEEEEEGAIQAGQSDDHAAADEIVDPAVSAFLAQQRAASTSHQSEEGARAKEERMKAGGVRGVKSRYQREKEEAERKKAEQALAAEEAYKDFAAAMDGGRTRGTEGGPGGEGARSKTMGFVSAGGELTRGRETTRSESAAD